VTVLYAAIDLPIAWARERAAEEPPPRLPALERLLARGARDAAAPDWRRWALGRAGLAAPAGDLPLGRLLAVAAGFAVGDTETWLVATPLSLRAGLTDLTVAGLGTALDAAGRAALAARFNADWRGAPWRLHVAGAAFLLAHAGPLALATADPESLLGRAPEPASGPDAPRLRRLASELEMWLHGAADAGVDFNALWPWAAGRGALAGTARWPAPEDGDPALAAARHCHPGPAQDARLVRWSLAALGASADPLAEAERRWFAPLAAALAGGRLARAELHFGSRTLEFRPAQRFRLWRRPRPWWELAA
jgi:hypothetical protein